MERVRLTALTLMQREKLSEALSSPHYHDPSLFCTEQQAAPTDPQRYRRRREALSGSESRAAGVSRPAGPPTLPAREGVPPRCTPTHWNWTHGTTCRGSPPPLELDTWDYLPQHTLINWNWTHATIRHGPLPTTGTGHMELPATANSHPLELDTWSYMPWPTPTQRTWTHGTTSHGQVPPTGTGHM